MRKRIERLAQRIVANGDAVQAVVLFGSRARGDHREDSDWDLAVLVRRRGPAAGDVALLKQMDRVQVAVYTPAEIESHADAAGSFEAAIADQGVLLAGSWEAPVPRTLRVCPSYITVWNDICLGRLVSALRLIPAADSRAHAQRSFVEYCEGAAEALGWLVLATFRVLPARRHRVPELARLLREGANEEIGLEGQEAQALAKFVAEHAFSPASGGTRSARERLRETLGVHAKWAQSCQQQWCESATGIGNGTRRARRRIATSLAEDNLDPATRDACVRWLETALA